MEEYLEGEPDGERFGARLREMVAACELSPVYTGSAHRDVGVGELMDAMCELLPGPTGDSHAELSGVVFGFMSDKAMGRAAICRIFAGELAVRTEFAGQKITQINLLSASGWEDAPRAGAGQIAAVFGVSDLRMGQAGHAAAESEYRKPRHLKESSSAVVHYLFPLGRMWQVQQ